MYVHVDGIITSNVDILVKLNHMTDLVYRTYNPPCSMCLFVCVRACELVCVSVYKENYEFAQYIWVYNEVVK